MINYYFVAYFLAFVSVLLIVYTFVLLKKGKGEDSVFVISTFAMISMYFGYITYSHQEKIDENISLGRYYVEQCKLIEGNVDNGFFSSNTNKLSCDGSIINVTVSDYNEAINTFIKRK